MKKITTRQIAVISILGALCVVMGFTPIGYIPIGPTKATIIHIPVIIAAIMEGPVAGAIVGLIFGISSILNAIFFPTPVAYVFLNPLVSVVPRILIGITSYYAFTLFKNTRKEVSAFLVTAAFSGISYYLIHSAIQSAGRGEILNLAFNIILFLAAWGSMAYYILRSESKTLAAAAGAAVGTLTNTVLVLTAIYFLYARSFMESLGGDPAAAGDFLWGIGIANGIPEVIAAVVLVTAVTTALQKRQNRR